jgi:hypothetical protein
LAQVPGGAILRASSPGQRGACIEPGVIEKVVGLPNELSCAAVQQSGPWRCTRATST